MKLLYILSVVFLLQCVEGMVQFLGELDLESSTIKANYTINAKGVFVFFNQKIKESSNNEKTLTLESETKIGQQQFGKFVFPHCTITENSNEITGEVRDEIKDMLQHATVKLKYANVYENYDTYTQYPNIIMFYLPENLFPTLSDEIADIRLNQLNSIVFFGNQKNKILEKNLIGKTNVNILIYNESFILNNDNSQLNINTQNILKFHISGNSSITLDNSKCLSGAITEFIGYTTGDMLVKINVTTPIMLENLTIIFNNVDQTTKHAFTTGENSIIYFSINPD